MRLDAHSATRKPHVLAACPVAPAICHAVMPRLDTVMRPVARPGCRQAPAPHAPTPVSGWLSARERHNGESIADRFVHECLPLQRCGGGAAWDAAPLRQALRRHVAQHWGHADGVLVWEWSAVPQPRTDAVGVARQWWRAPYSARKAMRRRWW